MSNNYCGIMDKVQITRLYTKRRSQFGKQCLFSDCGPELCDSFGPNKAEYKNYILRNPVHQACQNANEMSEHEVNTVRAEYTNSGINHYEGGWPKDININDPEATQRYRRKIEKDDSYVHCVMHLTHEMEHYIQQNNAIDMYQTYFQDIDPAPPIERSTCRTVNVYRDQSSAKRPIVSLSWSTDGGQRLATAHADLEFQRAPPDICKDSYIWDIENPNKPQLVITPPEPLCHLECNPRDLHTLIGGLMSGQVASFDVRRGSAPCVICPPHVAHRDPTRSVLYINSKTGTELFSASTDGQLKWWDTRNMNEPTDQMIIDPVKTQTEQQQLSRALGVCVLEYESSIPTRFMCGTEQGLVITGNRKGKTATEKLPGRFQAHHGAVCTVQRNPGFVKNFLTIGDWTARIWSEDCKENAIIWTNYHRNGLTDGAWSPIRFSLFMTVQKDGCLCCWDLLRRQYGPVATAQLCDEPLSKIKAHEGGRLVACGSRKGSVYLAELSENLGVAAKNDKLLMTHMFDRESKRERILEARLREIRLKLRQTKQLNPASDSHQGSEASVVGGSDRDLVEAELEYRRIIENELRPEPPPQVTPLTEEEDPLQHQ